MPLLKSPSRAAVGSNISEMRASGYPRKQAIAASLSNARKYGAHFADGGPSWTERIAARGLMHEGLINSPVPGRTDKLPITVGGGAYVVPSSHVSGIGQDNTAAGGNILNKMFHMGPYGSAPSAPHGIKPNIPRVSMNMRKFARGGETYGHPTQIIAAGGEFVVPPHKLVEKFGSLKKAHAAMDHWIVTRRKKHAKTLAGLPGPKKD